MKKFILCVVAGYVLVFILFIGLPQMMGGRSRPSSSKSDPLTVIESQRLDPHEPTGLDQPSADVPEQSQALQIMQESQNLKRYETGPVETFYRNGTLSSEWILDPKTARGTFKTYTPEGRPWMIMPFVDNVLEGELKTFYREGPLFSGETYQAGAKDGAETWQYKNGKPWLDVAWRPGETAILSAFYSENGQRVDLPEVQNEQTPGYFKAFDEQGREVINLQQGGGEQSLVLKSYYETGSLSAEVGLKGKRLSGRVTRYYPDGTVWMETEFTDPQPIPNKTVYFENKAIAISETLIIEPQAEFEWKSYYPGGKIFWQLTKVMNQDQPSVFQLITHWQDEPSADIKKERVLL